MSRHSVEAIQPTSQQQWECSPRHSPFLTLLQTYLKSRPANGRWRSTPNDKMTQYCYRPRGALCMALRCVLH